MSPSLFLFDDAQARAFHPFSLTRPVGELLFGAFLLRERAERFWGISCVGHLSPEALHGFREDGAPGVAAFDMQDLSRPRILHSSRFVPRGPSPSFDERARTLVCQNEVVGYFLPEGAALSDEAALLAPARRPGFPELQIDGLILGAPWDLMTRNADQLREDIPEAFPGYAAEEVPGCHLLGNGLLSLGRDVEVEPGSVFDLRNGPIRLADGVRIQAHTRLAGPAYVGPGTTLLGGVISETSLGPVCKIRGEVESTVVLGFSNKAHDGFIGHAYLGRWVNLGAFTTNSDLKNNYGPVRVGGPDGPAETGLMKAGAFLGDHVKTGIGTLLNTGTVVGAGCNLFGGAMPPTYVPPFSWGSGSDLTGFRLDKFLEVARKAMTRRGVSMDAGMEAVLRRAWESSRQGRPEET